MGDLRKNKSIISAVLFGITAVISFVAMYFGSLLIVKPAVSVSAASGQSLEFSWTTQGIRAVGYANYPDDENKILKIQDEGELGLLNYQIMQGMDYSGWTIKLVRNMDMLSKVDENNKNWEPYWTPIPTGTNGKNIGIVFDGAGFTIKNLKTIITDNSTGIKGIGFFSNLVGGAVQNLTFEDCIFTYNYNGSEKLNTTMPTEVAVGTVAGFVEGTFINNVFIDNPKVSLTSNNINGHNFYVGAAVGKLSNYSYVLEEKDVIEMGTLNTVDVLGGSVKLVISNNSTGVAMGGYLGGLVGENISGSIINCKIKSVNIEGDLDNATGIYFAGGIVGRSMLRQTTGQNPVVSSLFNNIIMSNVNIIDKPAAIKVGALTGQSYINWSHSNIYFGNTTNELFGDQIYNDGLVTFESGCAGNYGALNAYFKKEGAFAECKESILNLASGRAYTTCDKHYVFDPNFKPYLFAKENYKFTDVNDSALTKAFYDNLNDLETSSGALYQIARPILKYQLKYDITESTVLTEDMVREAVKTLRIWSLDTNNEPFFGDYFDLDYNLIFDAKGGSWIIPSDVEGEEPTELFELIGKYKFRQVTSKPEDPKLTGYSFSGWYKEPTFRNEWKFNDSATPDKIGTEAVTLYAKWTINSFSVTFMVNGTEYDKMNNIEYNKPITQPAAPTIPGMEFTGWYSDEEFKNKWELGLMGKMMPGYDLVLYAGWLDILHELRESLKSSASYLEDKDYYTVASFNLLLDARDKAQKKCDGVEVDLEASEIILLINQSIIGLRVNVDVLKNHEAILNQNSNQNKYAFLYTSESYEAYRLAKGTAISYLEAFSDVDAGNVENLKSILKLLNEKFNALQKNPNLGTDETEIQNLLKSAEEINSSIDDSLIGDNYTEESWVKYQVALTTFLDIFDSNDPYLDEMQNAITNLKAAQAGLTLTDKPTPPVDPDPKPNPDDKNSGFSVSPILIGILVTVAMILIAGSVILIDILKRKNKKPKKEVDEDKEVYV